jgi:hypothetical protein
MSTAEPKRVLTEEHKLKLKEGREQAAAKKLQAEEEELIKRMKDLEKKKSKIAKKEAVNADPGDPEAEAGVDSNAQAESKTISSEGVDDQKKLSKEKVAKEKVAKEKVPKEPKEKVPKEPKERVPKEPKEKVPKEKEPKEPKEKEPKEKEPKEPKEKEPKEPKEKEPKEPKEKVPKEKEPVDLTPPAPLPTPVVTAPLPTPVVPTPEPYVEDSETEERKKKPIPKHVKTLVWNKYIGADKAKAPCMSCRQEEIGIRSFHCGHVLAESKGGDMTINNLRPICAACNGSMGTMSMNEFTSQFFGWAI